MDRAKKKAHPCKKATIRFLVCFVMGFLIGFAPSLSSTSLNKTVPMTQSENHYVLAATPNATEEEPPTTPQSSPTLHDQLEDRMGGDSGGSNLNRSLGETTTTSTSELPGLAQEEKLPPRNQLIIITPTTTAVSDHHHEGVTMKDILLRRMANTLRLVKPPLVWIVVESQPESPNLSETLRNTGVMYRHLVAKENFTTNHVKEEMDHLRNIALNHVELHRLGGIVHFADLYNTYDLAFFEDIRAIEVFGAWPLANLRRGKKKVGIEGPVCTSSKVVGWHLKKDATNQNQTAEELPIHISSFGFNSSILWDPERWGRVTPTQHDKQSSLNFVKQALVDEESKLKGIPGEDCSRINLWSTKSI